MEDKPVAYLMGHMLAVVGVIINVEHSHVYSYSKDNAYDLAIELNAMPCDDIKFITDESHIYIIAIKDLMPKCNIFVFF